MPADVGDQPLAECMDLRNVLRRFIIQPVPNVLMTDPTEAARRTILRPRNPKTPFGFAHQRRIDGREAHPSNRIGPLRPVSIYCCIGVPAHHQEVAACRMLRTERDQNTAYGIVPTLSP